MDEPKILELKRKHVRRGWLAFGIPVCIMMTPIYFKSVSGSIYPIIFFYIFTIAVLVYVSYLWSLMMLLYAKDQIIKRMERIEPPVAKGPMEAVLEPNRKEQDEPKAELPKGRK